MADENARRRKETEDEEPDVLGHTFVADEPGEDDPERKRKRKRKRKQSDQPEGDELGKRRK